MVQQKRDERNVAPKYIQVLPTFTIGVDNAEQITGASYRWCRDFADRNGVPIKRIGRKFLIDGPKFFAALERFEGAAGDEIEPAADQDPTTIVLERLGWAVKK